MADGIIQPLGNGIAGLMLLILTTVLALNTIQLSYILLLIVACWLVVVILINRAYPGMLRKALAKRHLEDTDLSISDETSVNVLIQELQNPHPGVVIYALKTLETVEQESLRHAIPSLLVHSSAEVRQQALECVDRLHMTSALNPLQERIQKESDPAVVGILLRTLSALAGADSADILIRYIHDPNPQIRTGAIIGLLRDCGIEGVLAAGTTLLEIAKADDPEQRKLAAHIIGELGISSFYAPLIPLLNDEQREVRRAAIWAAKQVRNPNLIPQVVGTLEDPALRGLTAIALGSWGEEILTELFHIFDHGDLEQESLATLIDVIGRIGGAPAETWLSHNLSHPSAIFRTQVMRALNRCGYHALGDDKDRIQAQIKSEATFATAILALIVDLDDALAGNLFLDSLHETLDQIRARIFDLLSFLYNPQAINDARVNLALAHNGRRAYALEVLDVTVSKPIKGWVYPLWTEDPPIQKFEELKSFFPSPHMTLEQCLREVLSGSEENFSIWCKACALYTIATHSLTALSECAFQALTAPQALLRETAVWTLARLKVSIDKDLIESLRNDPHPQVTRAVRLLDPRAGDEGAFTMLTTLEKVIILKKTNLFASLSDEILAAMAPLTEELWFEDQAEIIKKGELGKCMYIIIRGKVRVHDGDLTLNFLADGDVFGEMAVLDSESRVATVSAVEEVSLLRLAQEPFYELMHIQPEIAHGLIRTLSRHLRDRIRDLKALQVESEILQ